MLGGGAGVGVLTTVFSYFFVSATNAIHMALAKTPN